MTRRRRFEEVPATIVLTAGPVLDPTDNFDQSLDDLRVHRVETGSCTLDRCLGNRAEVSEEFRQRFLAGDHKAIARLLQINPAFINELWVAEAVQKEEHLRHVVGLRGGRPVGRDPNAFARGLALVAYVNALRAQTGTPLDQIFQRLGNGRVGLSQSRVRDLYYETIRQRTRSFLFEHGGPV